MTRMKGNMRSDKKLSTQKVLKKIIPEAFIMELATLSERLNSNTEPLLPFRGDQDEYLSINQSNIQR